MEATRSIGVVWPEREAPGEFDEVRRFAPDGVNVHMENARPYYDGPDEITLDRVLQMFDDIDAICDAATKLASLRVSIIGYACTAVSFVNGPSGARDIAEKITEATGLAATTTSSAMVNALRQLYVRRVAVLAPYVEAINEKLREFLEDSGFEVVDMKGLNMRGGIAGLSPETTRDLVVNQVNHPDADGVFVSCTSVRTASILDVMEQRIGKPVITANQATVWELLHMCGLFKETPGLGSLYLQPALRRG